MNERLCIRCQHPVLLEDGHLSFCSFCGAPQIFLSEDLQAEIARETREYTERTTPAAATPDSPTPSGEARRSAAQQPGQPLPPWTEAVQYALISAAVAMALGLLTLLLPSLDILMVLWAVAAPILTVGFFSARTTSLRPQGPAFAARLGLLTGLLIASVGAVIVTLGLVLARFVSHQTGPLDAQIAAVFEQQRTVLMQRFGAEAQPTISMFALPEFRVGMFLFMAAMGAAFYLFLSTVSAGLAGAVLGRRRSA